MTSVATTFRAFYQFSRPHTILGTSLSVVGLYAIALTDGNLADARWGPFAGALVACLAANVYIVGLNQLTDIDIDRINKPYLPLAAGHYTVRTATLLVFGCLLVALVVALGRGLFLSITVVGSLLLGTAYSLPPVRLKRFPFWAAFCIFAVRGVLVNLFLYLHFAAALHGRAGLPPKIWGLALFMFGLSLVIAWFKDIPDMEGDRRYEIATLTLRLGPRRVFDLGRGLLTACYLGLAVAGLIGIPDVNGAVLAGSHLVLLGVMWRAGAGIDPADKTAMTRYYMTVWGLFFAEYLVYPLACLTA